MTDRPGLRLVPGDERAGLVGARPAANTQGYLGVEEAAAFLATTPKAVYALVSRREIPFRRLGRRLLFDRAELRAMVEKGRVEPIQT